MPENTVVTATKDEPTAVFDEISFKKVGTYEYRIAEIAGRIPGVTYDLTVHTVVITVTKATDGSNRLVASLRYDDEDALTITNTFSPVEAAPEVTKELEGRQWKDDDVFTFRIAAVTEGAPMPAELTATATKSNPVAVFGSISYDTVGVYEYDITEDKGTIPGIGYDVAHHQVLVEVSADPEAGNALVASIRYDGTDALLVTNPFTPAEAKLEVTKALEGRAWGEEDTFSFQLEAVSEGAPMPAETTATATKAAPLAVFGSAVYTEPGTYDYRILEVEGNLTGVSYDISAHRATVSVTRDEESNALVASVSYDGEESLTITNTYTGPTPAEAVLEVTKALEGRAWADEDSFSFRLAAVTEGAPMPAETTATAVKDTPKAVFGSIVFLAPGSYEYSITEVEGSLIGVSYDLTAHKAVVTVTLDEENNRLLASVSYDEGAAGLTVTNTYTSPAPAEVAPQVTKAFSGRDWKDSDQFVFRLDPVTEGAPMPDSNSATARKSNPTAVFGTIRFDKIGTYVYHITELSGTIPAMTYDLTAHQVVVTVSMATDGSNRLVASVRYDGAASLTVTNTYTPTPVSVTLPGKKTISGKTAPSTPTFSFTLKETTAGSHYTDTATLVGSGSFSFKPISYTKAGVYTYEITEVKGSGTGWLYDSKKYTVTVTVTDNGSGKLSAAVSGIGTSGAEFNNHYDPSIPPTGDESNLLLWSLLALSSFTALAFVSLRLKKGFGRAREK